MKSNICSYHFILGVGEMIKYAEKQIIKDIITTNAEMHSNEFKLDRKGFIVKWKKQIKGNIKCLSDEYLKIDDDLADLLKQIGDTKLSAKIRSIIDNRECTYAYEQYNKGLFEGVKLALILKKKNLNLPI
jgi:hypothetical protein